MMGKYPVSQAGFSIPQKWVGAHLYFPCDALITMTNTWLTILFTSDGGSRAGGGEMLLKKHIRTNTTKLMHFLKGHALLLTMQTPLKLLFVLYFESQHINYIFFLKKG